MNNTFKVSIEEEAHGYARLIFEPLERGYGDTLGNALRRVLLSSINGAAVTAVKFDGVLHEFSTIKGVREDVIEILMNLKHIPIQYTGDMKPGEFKILSIDSRNFPADFFTRKDKPGILNAKDMPWDHEIEFMGDGTICTLEPDANFSMEVYVQKGTGYLSSDRDRPAGLPLDAVLTDAIFSPVSRVNYRVQPARVGQSIDFEKLILEVWTTDAILPVEAVTEAAQTAQEYFRHIAEITPDAVLIDPDEPEKLPEPLKEKSEISKLDEFSGKPIHELELTIRSENCLLRGGIQTIGDLLEKTHEDLLKIRNLGKISLNEIEDKLVKLGLSLKPSEQPEQEQEFNEDNAEDVQEISEDNAENQKLEEIETEEPKIKPAKPGRKPKNKKTEFFFNLVV